MAAQPTDDISFASSPTVTPVDPGGTKKNTGWLVDEAPPASWFNWFFRAWYRWINWAKLTILSTLVPLQGLGRSWLLAPAAQANTWNGVCWSETYQKFFAVCPDGSNQVATSPDGITWTVAAAILAGYDFKAIAAGGSSVVGVATAGASQAVYTPDGTNYSYGTVSEANAWNSVCYSPALTMFLAVASSGTNRTMRSTNGGANWSAGAAAAANSWNGVCWSPALAKFVAVSSDGASRVMTSSDGVNWSSASAATANQWQSVCWAEDLGLFVAVANSGTNRVMYSSNGTAWSAAASADETAGWTSVCYSSELQQFVAVAASGTNRIMVSSNGSTWYAVTAPEANSWNSVCWAPQIGTYLAVASSGTHRVMLAGASAAQCGALSGASDVAGTISRAFASATGLTTGTTINVGTTASITLTPGEWEVSGAVGFSVAATTTVTNLVGAVSKTSATLPATSTRALPTAGEVRYEFSQASAANNGQVTVPIVPFRVNVTADTPIYLVAQATFATAACSAYGYMEARRLRS